jgi:hypothetical protein
MRKGGTYGDGVEEGGCEPVDADPGLLGTCDASLAREKRDSWGWM